MNQTEKVAKWCNEYYGNHFDLAKVDEIAAAISRLFEEVESED